MIHGAGSPVKSVMLAHALVAPLPRVPRKSAVILPMTRPVQEFDLLVVQVAQARDRAAFAALFAHFAPRVKAWLMRQNAPASQAEDLAQEALLTVWRKAALFDPAKASAGTWVFTIARNLRIDAIRRERRPELDPDDLLPEASPDPDHAIALADGEVRLRVAMRSLPPDQVAVIQASFFADKPHSQIAAELGIPLGTVKSRLRLAMARLRGAMGEAS